MRLISNLFLILILFLPNLLWAEGRSCESFLLGVENAGIKESEPIRQKYSSIALSAKKGLGRNAVFLEYATLHMARLNQRLSEPGSPQYLIPLIEKLKQTSQIVLNDKSFDLAAFNKLTYLYHIVFDYQLDPETNHEEFFERWIRPRYSFSNVVHIFSSSSDLAGWALKTNFLHFYHDNRFPDWSLAEDPDWALIPTFANIGFETMLWGISRKILFVGQTHKTVYVDGNALKPSLFQYHDYLHSAAIMKGTLFKDVTLDESAEFWDKIESYYLNSDIMDREKKLHITILFFLIHEANALGMSGHPKNKVVLNTSTLHFRFSQDNDLNERFDEKPKIEEIMKGAVSLGHVLDELFGIKLRFTW